MSAHEKVQCDGCGKVIDETEINKIKIDRDNVKREYCSDCSGV